MDDLDRPLGGDEDEHELLVAAGIAVEATPGSGDQDLAAGAATDRWRRWRRRRPVRRTLVLLHRWVSLVFALLLVMVTTSGAFLVYSPEWTRWNNAKAYAESSSQINVSPPAAIDIVNGAHPDEKANFVILHGGVYEVSGSQESWYTVDPSNGRILGRVKHDVGFMGFMGQVHDCFFQCSTLPGYVAALGHPVPTLGMKWLTDITWGGFLLGVSAMLLLFVGLSGLWLWWGTVKRWVDVVRVRWRRGRYARDFDLHNVVGLAAAPFLLIWGLTGAMFTFPWVTPTWYAATGGHAIDHSLTSNPVPKGTPDLPPDAAIAAARAAIAKTHSGPIRITVFAPPSPDDPTATYFMYAQVKGFDLGRYAFVFPGQVIVSVDRHDASRVDVSDLTAGAAPTASNFLADTMSWAMHQGYAFNPWWRLLWFGFGMAPLLLALTGLSTWLAKRGVRKRRRKTTMASVEPTPPPTAAG